ncbi:MAG: hypothetical protein EKK48_08970 [Candidatus Melainabacteria bacterium]|nr:MAG: hypothetical protein EKK48_08970 [Candidatus Melainabacteria bacterium]
MANQDYRAGEYLSCTIDGEEPGGYTVTVSGDDRVGFLPTSVTCRLGEVVKAQFICMKGERILVSAKFNDQQKRSERKAKSAAEFARHAGRPKQEAVAGDTGKSAE